MSPRMSNVKKEETKKMIAEKSLEAFRNDGYHGTSMSTISSYTGISKGGMYAYFSNKEDLFIYILDYLLNQKPIVLNKQNNQESAFDQLVTQWTNIIFSWSTMDLSTTKLIYEFWMESSKNKNYRDKLLRNYFITEKYFLDILEYGKAQNEFKEDLDCFIMTQIFWSYIDGQVQFWIARNYYPNKEDLESVLKNIKILIEGIRKC